MVLYILCMQVFYFSLIIGLLNIVVLSDTEYFKHIYCQTNTDNRSDTSYKRTRSSPLHINH